MMSVLKKICAYKKKQVNQLKKNVSEKFLIDKIKNLEKPRGFKKALDENLLNNKFSLIAEIKKASPSKGLIRNDFSPKNIAQSYKNAGASCISVLTENNWFKGNISDLKEVRESCDLPILRKDFILDTWQVLESRSIGADCILVILSAVNDATAKQLIFTSKELGMDTLVEVHNEKELNRAIKLNSDLIGINNRNLNTLSVDLNTTLNLASKIPYKYDIVCESGIEKNKDLKTIAKVGIKRFFSW